MAILKLNGFDCVAEILGQPRGVTFTGDKLIVSGVELIDANRIIEALAIDTLIGISLPTGTDATKPVEKTKEQPVQAQEKPQEPEKHKRHKKEAEPEVKEEAKVEEPVKSHLLTPTERAPVKATKQVTLPTEPTEQAPKEEAKPASAAMTGSDDALVTAFGDMKKLRDMIAHLQKQGIVTELDIVQALTRVKDKVKILSSVPNIADRVHRSLDILNGTPLT